MDLQDDVFGETTFGRVALKKMGPTTENFRIFAAGWLGPKPEDWKEMRVTGAEFRRATRGPDKGQLVIKLPGTVRSVMVSRDEMVAFEAQEMKNEEQT